MDNIYKKHFFTGALKNLLKFLKQFLKKVHVETAVLRCLLDRCPEKSANFTKKHQCWSHFLKKSPEIKRLQHRYFPVNF